MLLVLPIRTYLPIALQDRVYESTKLISPIAKNTIMEDEETITEQQDSNQTLAIDSKEKANELAEMWVSRAQNKREMLKSRYEIMESQVQRLVLLKIGLTVIFAMVLSGISLSGNLDIFSSVKITPRRFLIIVVLMLVVFILIAIFQIAVTKISLGDRYPTVFPEYVVPSGGSDTTGAESTTGVTNEVADELMEQSERLSEFPRAQNKLLTEVKEIEQIQSEINDLKDRLRTAYTVLSYILLLIILLGIMPVI